MRCQKLGLQVFEVQSFGLDTGQQSFRYSFVALSIIRCSKSAKKYAVRCVKSQLHCSVTGLNRHWSSLFDRLLVHQRYRWAIVEGLCACVKTNKHIIKIFPPSGSRYRRDILVFPCQTAILRQGLPNTGASNAGWVGRNRDSEPISDYSACC